MKNTRGRPVSNPGRIKVGLSLRKEDNKLLCDLSEQTLMNKSTVVVDALKLYNGEKIDSGKDSGDINIEFNFKRLDDAKIKDILMFGLKCGASKAIVR